MENERKKAEKLAKFEEKKKKQALQQKQAEDSESRNTKKKTLHTTVKYVEETPVGQKKILKSLDDEQYKAYQPNIVESAWYSWWEAQGYFKPTFQQNGDVKSKGRFVIVIPPPNVTGKLHVGHALATSLQDTLIRYHRMRGFTTLFLPGTDHAGISTQAVVESRLWREKKQTRHDLGRDAFIKTVWQWKEDTHISINQTLQRLGASVDWSREAFTMDANLSKAVTETFVRLHEEGYIYRSSRLVNWCSVLNTALSNLEVDNKELTGRTLLEIPGYTKKVEFGVLTHFMYEIEGSETKETIEVATTRPETMLGDTGIAVNPNDTRYKHLVGRKARHPFIKDRVMPIVADDYVDMEFGTGAVKITPAHDNNDWELGKRHSLDIINILNDNGTMNANAGKEYEGMKRFDARPKVIEDLKQLGLYVKAVDNPMKVPVCQKSKDVIEFLPKPQWWMRMAELVKPALTAVQDGTIKIRPDTARRNYENWLTNIQDWCLSRQLWWGHQIPAYYVEFEGESSKQDADAERWIIARSEQEAQDKAASKFPGKTIKLRRDDDVLDTWFSSGLWPFSTLGWPDETPDMAKLFPTSVLETGWDILFFWVARMIIFSLKLTGQVPFTEVFCHGLIRDSEGRKMSKSLGNVVDPVDIMDGIPLQALHDKLRVGNLDPKEVALAEKYQKKAFPLGIPQCGADALRLTLIDYVTVSGGDISFDIKVMEAYRRFCNKVYQASKFVLSNTLTVSFAPAARHAASPDASPADLWILRQFDDAVRAVTAALDARDFSSATRAAFHYFRDALCDVYIEYSKKTLRDGSDAAKEVTRQTLYTCLEGGLLLLHPFMPFLTEELWQRLPRRAGDTTESVVIAAWPEAGATLAEAGQGAAAVDEFELNIDVADAIKSLAATQKLTSPRFAVRLSGKAEGGRAELKHVQTLCQYVKPALGEGAVRWAEGDEGVEGALANVEQGRVTVFVTDAPPASS